MAVRMEERPIGRLVFYRLVDVVTDLIVCGGLRSAAEAVEWARDNGYDLTNPPAVIASVRMPTRSDLQGMEPGQIQATMTGIGAVLAVDPSALVEPTSAGVRPAGSAGEAEVQAGPPLAKATASPAPPRSNAWRTALFAAGRARSVAERPKSSYSCCAATRDRYNRLCIGDCGPDCLRRAARRRSA